MPRNSLKTLPIQAELSVETLECTNLKQLLLCKNDYLFTLFFFEKVIAHQTGIDFIKKN